MGVGVFIKWWHNPYYYWICPGYYEVLLSLLRPIRGKMPAYCLKQATIASPTFFRFMIDNHPVLPAIKIFMLKLSKLSSVSQRYFSGTRDENMSALSRHLKLWASAIEASPQPEFTYLCIQFWINFILSWNFIIRKFMVYTLYQILLKLSDQGGCNGMITWPWRDEIFMWSFSQKSVK